MPAVFSKATAAADETRRNELKAYVEALTGGDITSADSSTWLSHSWQDAVKREEKHWAEKLKIEEETKAHMYSRDAPKKRKLF